MSKEIPTPYVWSFNPQMGTAAGASQDYSTKMNWMSAGNHMIQQVNDIRDSRNQILLRQGAITETSRNVINPPTWPSTLLIQPNLPPTTLELPRNHRLEQAMTHSGMQLAGGKLPYVGFGIQMNDSAVPTLKLRPDGIFQLAGGSRSSFNPDTARYLALQSQPTVARSGGMGSWQFTREFVPAVYLNPFSGQPNSYPDEFIFNYDLIANSVDGYD